MHYINPLLTLTFTSLLHPINGLFSRTTSVSRYQKGNTIHTFNGSLSGTTQVSWYHKGKTNLDFTEARDSEWQWHQLGHMHVCTSRQITMPAPNRSVFYRPDALPADQSAASKHWRQKGNTSLDLNEGNRWRGSGMLWHQLDHMQTICTSFQTDNHTNTSSLSFYRLDALPVAQPTVPKHWRNIHISFQEKVTSSSSMWVMWPANILAPLPIHLVQ